MVYVVRGDKRAKEAALFAEEYSTVIVGSRQQGKVHACGVCDRRFSRKVDYVRHFAAKHVYKKTIREWGGSHT